MENNDEKLLLAIAAVCLIKKKIESEKAIRKKKWSKDWLLKRQSFSHTNLIAESLSEPEDFRNYLRMDAATYEHLLSLVAPLITRADSVMRRAITPHERLSATLRLLATGRSYEDLKCTTCISEPLFNDIIPKTCDAIYKILKDTYRKVVASTSMKF